MAEALVKMGTAGIVMLLRMCEFPPSQMGRKAVGGLVLI